MEDAELNEDHQFLQEVPSYNIGKLQDPPLLKATSEEASCSLSKENISKDILWAMAGGFTCDADVEDSLTLLGSWTAYQKFVTDI